MIQNGFKYREEFNRIYVRLQSTGIVHRANKKYRTTILKHSYSAKENYKVELEGVLFEHVKLIFLIYSLIFPFVLIVLAIEILFKWITLRVATKIQQNIEDLDVVATSSELISLEVLEVIDLE